MQPDAADRAAVTEESRPSWRLRCKEIFTNGHTVIVVLTALGIAGSAVGVYTSLHSDITENRRAVDDLLRDFNKFVDQTDKWQTREMGYDAELRGHVADADREARAAVRELTSKVIDLAKAVGQAQK